MHFVNVVLDSFGRTGFGDRDPKQGEYLFTLRRTVKFQFLYGRWLVWASLLSYNTILCFDVFLTVHHSIELFHLPTLMHNSLFIKNVYVTLLSSTCFEH